ncbi:MAG: GntR family transcriptional regulator [Solirubrobacteraceae bacterium]|nr:GntR family transcriptional regulator [Solirubrobacteraceae bacterium]
MEGVPASRHREAAAARRVAVRRGQGNGAARRLRDVLRSNIVTGIYPSGLLPGETELMVSYGAPRAAVRDALSMLREEGLVERVQGIGTFSICDARYTSTFEEMHGDVPEDADVQRSRPQILERAVIPAPDAVARKLEIAPGEPVLLLEYVGFVDGVAVWLASNYLRFPEAERLRTAPFESTFTGLLDATGLRMGGSHWQLSAVNADAAVAAVLNVKPGTALMLGEELICDADGRVYDYAVCYFRSDRHSFVSSTGRFASDVR